MADTVFPPGSQNFKDDIEYLLPLLPMREGEDVQREVMLEVIVQAGRELEMDWVDNLRDRAGILFGVVHACMVQRGRRDFGIDDGISAGLEQLGLERDEGAVFERLADELVDVLKVKI
ncbi:Nn.00g041040.m01.CDS01 [Neocucurbitaria sp. VM-36]